MLSTLCLITVETIQNTFVILSAIIKPLKSEDAAQHLAVIVFFSFGKVQNPANVESSRPTSPNLMHDKPDDELLSSMQQGFWH